MLLNRSFTSVINWCLDNLAPPIIRDCRPLMRFIIRFAYGDKTELVMGFKEKLPYLSEDEISGYYSSIQNVPVNMRPTDLNKKSMDFITENLIGQSVLDVACGRGYLINKISEDESLEVAAIDLVKPSSLKNMIKFTQGSIVNIPLADNSYDTVICSHALEHIVESDKALNELDRVAKKRIIIVVPRQRNYRYTPDLHVNFYPYLYSFQMFINNPSAKYWRFGNDFLCIIDK